MADIIPEDLTKPSEDAPNQVEAVNSEQAETYDLSYDELLSQSLLGVADDAAIWVFGVGGPA